MRNDETINENMLIVNTDGDYECIRHGSIEWRRIGHLSLGNLKTNAAEQAVGKKGY